MFLDEFTGDFFGVLVKIAPKLGDWKSKSFTCNSMLLLCPTGDAKPSTGF